jgi:uncharacterized RDD family membrane protein YckC
VLRDDPELRLKLRDRLHRARLDRRKQNDNPLASGPDPEAPDWFEPELGGDNGDGEAEIASAPGTGERSKERKIVRIDDLSGDDDMRGGATTADSDNDAEIIEASRESDGDDEPSFDGDIPGFTDWREELRERLKRIRARREQERIAEEEQDEAAAIAAAETEDGEAEAAAAASDEEAEDAMAESGADDEAGGVAAERKAVAEASEAPGEPETIEGDADIGTTPSDTTDEKATTARDIIAQIVDGPGAERDVDLKPAATAEVDFILEREAAEVEHEDEGPAADVLILGEKGAGPQASPSADDEDETEAPLAATSREKKGADATADVDDEAEDEEGQEATAVLEDVDDDAEDEEEQEATAVLEDVDDDAEDEEEQEATAGLEDVDDEAQDEEPEIIEAVADEEETDTEALGDLEDAEEDAEAAGHGKAEGDVEKPAALPGGEDESDQEIRGEADDEADATKAPDKVASEPAAEGKSGRGTFDWGNVVASKTKGTRAQPGDKQAGTMPGPLATAGAPELDFEAGPKAGGPVSPEIDLPEDEEEDLRALEWDSDDVGTEHATPSSVGPLGERAAAFLCDVLVLTAIGAALVGAASSGAGVPFRQILVEETLWLVLAWSIFAIGYSVFLVGACGQTIGRMVMRLRVIGDQQFTVGFDRAAIRLAAWVVSALPAFIGMLPALRDPQRRALHDRLSHTRVVKA